MRAGVDIEHEELYCLDVLWMRFVCVVQYFRGRCGAQH